VRAPTSAILPAGGLPLFDALLNAFSFGECGDQLSVPRSVWMRWIGNRLSSVTPSPNARQDSQCEVAAQAFS